MVQRSVNRLPKTLVILPQGSVCVSFRFYSRVIALKVCLSDLFIYSIFLSIITLWQSNINISVPVVEYFIMWSKVFKKMTPAPI